MCLGCHEMKPKKELIRIVKDMDGCISIDHSGKKSGRGAYICRSLDCFENMKKGRKIEKSFETRIDEIVYDTLKRQLEGDND